MIVQMMTVAAILIGSPDPRIETPPDQPTADLQSFTAAAGQVLGAATVCDDIQKARVEKAAARVGEVAKDAAAGPDELNATHALFRKSLREGSKAIASGDTDCQHVNALLQALEQAFDQ
jgi:hypothetical protein